MSIPMKRAFGKKPAAVNIKRNFYTMASVDGDSAEITMYGDIVEEQPRDWWTDEPVEGQYIVESEFLEDLNAVAGCKKLTIRMTSASCASVPVRWPHRTTTARTSTPPTWCPDAIRKGVGHEKSTNHEWSLRLQTGRFPARSADYQ